MLHFADNTAANAAAKRGYSSSPDLALLVSSMHLRIARLGIRIWIEFVPSALNFADAPSRSDFRQLDRLHAIRIRSHSRRWLAGRHNSFLPLIFTQKKFDGFALGPRGLARCSPEAWRRLLASVPTNASRPHAAKSEAASGAPRTTRPLFPCAMCVSKSNRTHSQVALLKFAPS